MSGSEFSEATYTVVCNDEEQYSIWRSDRAVPAGWQTVGQPMPKDQCLKYIEEVWTDMRPASLRRAHAYGRAAAVR